MRYLGRIISLLLCIALFTSCSKSGEKTPHESLTETTAAPVSQGENLGDDEISQSMLKRSLTSLGDEARMMNVLRKAENGEDITVAYLGGSITQGYLVGSSQCWARLSYDWLCKQYPDTNINFINAGMSGTPSTLGVIRCDRDLYSQHAPDIVFIEFAVNDEQTDLDKKAFESLVLKILKKENNPAVVLLFTVMEDGYTCEEQMSEIGSYYNLPMISVDRAIRPELENRRLLWNKYALDQAHPTVWGHRLVSDFVVNYWEKVREDMKGLSPLPEIKPIQSAPLNKDCFEEIRLLTSSNLNADSLGDFRLSEEIFSWFPDGWENSSGGKAPIEFSVECKALFLFYLCDCDPSFGSVNIYVDDKLIKSVDSFSTKGWHNPEALLIFSDETPAIHKVSIKLQSENSYFGLLGLGAC